MRIVLQRVLRSTVEVTNETVGQIPEGLLLFLGIAKGDTEQDADRLAQKVLDLRIFPDEFGKMNLSVKDADGSILVVSQFTLYGDCKKGTRPSFAGAAPPEEAERLYEYFTRKIRESDLHVETGSFGEKMDVYLVNDGPVTLILDS